MIPIIIISLLPTLPLLQWNPEFVYRMTDTLSNDEIQFELIEGGLLDSFPIFFFFLSLKYRESVIIKYLFSYWTFHVVSFYSPLCS